VRFQHIFFPLFPQFGRRQECAFGFNSHQDVGVVENQKCMIELQKFEAREEIITALEDM
jgi:hypothetical protein